MFKISTPESVGISSEKVYSFFETINSYGLNTHSVIMARGNNIFAESYYAPYEKNSLQRMYSVSKSFVAIAVGLAEQEGLLSLDDCFLKYFPEYINENIDEKYRETTIRDMLTMRSCMAKVPDWWGKNDRAKAYFDETSNQISGTNFYYDSAGSFLIGCIVEKVTGMPFLVYLKQKVLLDIGFSKESYCLLAPGGHSHGDSGVMCKARDLLIFARFVMNGGVWNGKRYINEEFMQSAVSKQTDNYISGTVTPPYYNNGYGYLIWKMPRDGFAFIGMACQYVICDPATDFIFVITSENMGGEAVAATVIINELYKNIIPYLSSPLKEDRNSQQKLTEFLSNQKIHCLKNSVCDNISADINGIKYLLKENPMFIKSIRLSFTENSGVFEFENDEGTNRITFGIGYNVFGKFPTKKRMSLTASVYEDGAYNCAASAVWCEKNKLHIIVRVIDTYLGTLSIVIGFKDDKITVTMQKHSQRILDNYNGTATGHKV